MARKQPRKRPPALRASISQSAGLSPDSCLVSAMIIVKNEAASLDRCLRAVTGIVDEVVVVDTGSTDESMDIARRHGVRLFTFEWCNDFAAARTESMRHARGDWLIWVDADEELIEDQPGALRRLCRLPNPPEGYLITCRNLINDKGDIGTVIRQWRLFRNHIGLRFNGRIHEHLVHEDGSTEAYLLPQDDVWIRHWGYIVKGDSLERKTARNLPLLQACIDDAPDNPFHRYNLGKQYLAQHLFEPGLAAMEKAIELWQQKGRPEYAYVGNMFALAINAAVELRRNQRAVELEALVPEGCMSPDVQFQAGVAWWRLGHREEGRKRLNRAWQDVSLKRAIESDPSHATWRPLAALAEMHLETDEPEVAYGLACKAHEYAPKMPNIMYALGFMAGRLKRYDEAIEWARKLLAGEADDGFKPQARRLLINVGRGLSRPEVVLEGCSGDIEGLPEAEAVLIAAQAHGQLQNAQAQYDVLEAGRQRFPADTSILMALSDLLYAQGFVPEALSVLSPGIDDPSSPPDLYERLAVLLMKRGQLEDAANALALAKNMRAGSASQPKLAPELVLSR